MFTIDNDSKKFLHDRLEGNQAVRVYFGGFGWGGPNLGLALEEPKEGDEKYEVNGLTFILDPFALKLVKDAGGVTITNSYFGPVAELQAAANAGCGCS